MNLVQLFVFLYLIKINAFDQKIKGKKDNFKDTSHLKINLGTFTQTQNVKIRHSSTLLNNENGIKENKKYTLIINNQCPVTILIGAIGPYPILPMDGDHWDLNSGKTMTFVLPQNWLNTTSDRKNGPRFWARTGCKFDRTTNKAQCEIGDCDNYYDCSKANISGKIPVSLAEFCFECKSGITSYDVSLVDGYSISIDIRPGTSSSVNPIDRNDTFWCKTTLCQDAVDLRTNCPEDFTLYNTNLTSFNQGNDTKNKIACFSNCGRYEYPTAPLKTCNSTDEKCKNWKRFCCQSSRNEKNCTSNLDCDEDTICYLGKCSCTAYYVKPPCDSDICTNQNIQPIPGNCSSFPEQCIGDDTVHNICHSAYSWPNDPQTYNCDSSSYTITFCPGGTNEQISNSVPIPNCDSLNETYYDYKTAKVYCSEVNATYGCAVSKMNFPSIWSCDVDKVPCNHVICKW